MKKKNIRWEESKEGTVEGYIGDVMYFDINKEDGRFAVYEMKKNGIAAMGRLDFSTLSIAKSHCSKLSLST